MIKALVERLIRKQEAVTGESADFMRDIYAGNPGAFWRFAMFVPMSRVAGTLPLDAACAVRIAASHAEDCGPCLQTTITLSLAAGANPDMLRAAVASNTTAMDEKTRIAFEFAEAIIAHDIRAEELRPVIEAWWGKAGITEIALAIASTRVYPMVKRAMGYAHACQHVVIEGETADASLREAAAA